MTIIIPVMEQCQLSYVLLVSQFLNYANSTAKDRPMFPTVTPFPPVVIPNKLGITLTEPLVRTV